VLAPERIHFLKSVLFNTVTVWSKHEGTNVKMPTS